MLPHRGAVMIRRALLILPLLLPVAAAAQSPSETRLRLSESGSVQARPDELTATLRVEIRAATAAAAQEQVNQRVAASLAAIRAIEGVQVTTGPYGAHTDRDKQEVVAQQSLNLKGGQGEALLALIARLQSEGMLLDNLGWHLSDAAARTARDGATRAAIRAVQERGASVARDLGLRVYALRDLYIEAAPEGRPMMMAARAAGPTAPSVTAEEITVSARVTADLLLRR